jgi:hypothetical protein
LVKNTGPNVTEPDSTVCTQLPSIIFIVGNIVNINVSLDLVVMELLRIIRLHEKSVAPWVNSVVAMTHFEERRQVEVVAGTSKGNLKTAEAPLAPDLDAVQPRLVRSIRGQPWNQTLVVALDVAATTEDVRHDEPADFLLYATEWVANLVDH